MALSVTGREIKKQIDDVLKLINDSNHDSMITDLGTKNAIMFCNIKKICELNQMSLILDATLQGYRRTEEMDEIKVSIVIDSPCCISHALEEISEEFSQLFDDLYGELPYCREYILEGLKVKNVTHNLISVELELGT
jgi:hypothetical protein